MSDKFLEQFYETVVLPRYARVIKFDKITWTSHGKIGLDAWAHYFETGKDKKEYVLLYEDFPGDTYVTDGLSHEVIKLGDQYAIELKFNDTGNSNYVPNILGWFSLYREISR